MRRTAQHLAQHLAAPAAPGYGAVGLDDADLLTLLVGQDTEAPALAERLLERFDGLGGVLRQDGRSLAMVKGVGPVAAARVAAVGELAARAELAQVRRGTYLDSTDAVRRFLWWRLGGLPREVFGLVLLNSRHQVICIDYLFYGSVDRSAVYIREILKCCMRANAAAVVLFHNHPSGDLVPSAQDRDLTDRAIALLGEVDVEVMDHVIVGDVGQVSMAALGMVNATAWQR